MKALFLSLLFILLAISGVAQSNELKSVREAFHKALLDETNIEAFYNLAANVSKSNPTITAYKAVSEALTAKTAWNPFSKIMYLKQFEQKMNAAIMEDPNNLEIRFLRFSVEFNLPTFLGMSQHLSEDMEKIVELGSSILLLNIDPKFKRYILYFLGTTKLFTAEQMTHMKDLMSNA